MKKEKFKSEVETLLKFIAIYCHSNHNEQINAHELITYKQEHIKTNTKLCNNCKELYLYSINRLQNCPHEEKPKCRKCLNPCYEKQQWKDLAKIMRSSGMILGLTKIKKIFIK